MCTNSKIINFVCFGVLVLLGGCGIFPSIPDSTFKNIRTPNAESANYFNDHKYIGAWVDTGNRFWLDSVENSDRPFVGIALSGGGSRSAVFSNSVLKLLDELGVLKHATVLSTVSGGSISGAYYALNARKFGSDYWQIAHSELSKDLRDRWLLSYFAPWNVIRSFLTDYDRSDTLADIYDGNLFHRATFGDLLFMGAGRPSLLINASIVGSPPYRLSELSTRGNDASSIRSNGFVFSVEGFAALGSSLKDYPLSSAVAASSAFPTVFNPVTLSQYAPNTLSTFNRRHEFGDKELGYVHLIDGGVSDNLGVDALISSATKHYQHKHLLSKDKKDSCLLILVDADIDRGHRNEAYRRDLRASPIDYAFDDSANYAINALFSRRREETLKELGINLGRRQGYDYLRSAKSVNIKIGENGWSGAPGFVMSIPGEEKEVDSISCTTWHIGLQEVFSLNVIAGGVPQSDRVKLWNVVNSVGTDLKLTGVGSCSSDFIATRLDEAARILVKEDIKSRRVVCNWFRENGMPSPEICNIANVRRAELDFDVFTQAKENGHPSGLVTCDQEKLPAHF